MDIGRSRGASDGRENRTTAVARASWQPEAADIVRLGRRLLRGLVRAAREDPDVTTVDLLSAHLGAAAASRPVVGTSWPAYEHINVQLGLEAWLAQNQGPHTVVGLSNYQHREFSLGDLAQSTQHGPVIGNTAMVQLATGPAGEVHDCYRCAVILATDGRDPIALLLREADPHGPGGPAVRLEALATSTEAADHVLKEIGELTVANNVFRGQVLAFGSEVFGPRQSATLQFLARPSLERTELILPPRTLARIERQVVDIAKQRRALRSARQHLKRGVLLYGPPGTGKTHTIRYLLGELQGVTVIVLSGAALAAISQACSIARELQPAAVIVEDVDLIAEQRGFHPGQHPLLFQLLNEMDGLGEDVDVVFLLTTNRPDLLEPALTTRPGRVDQAIEIPLPDAEGRRALMELYKGGLNLEIDDYDSILERTAGVTASFLKELLRRSALVALGDLDGGEVPLTVEMRHIESALNELLDPENQLTRSLLGGAPEA